MKLFNGLLGIVYLVTTSFHNAPKGDLREDKVEIHEVKTEIKKEEVRAEVDKEVVIKNLYSSIPFESGHQLNFIVFAKALQGFENLKKAGKLDQDAHILTVCDFSMSSNTKRLWVLDLKDKQVLFNSLVAHGKNTGEEFAQYFSNTESSLQSSIGFYITDETYNGSNGYSLKLLGMDPGYNDAALQRAVVMHGADYVSEAFAAQHKRIGRSWGCPAVPRALAEPIINTIKDKKCLFIYYPDEQYLNSSQWLK